MGPQGGEGPVQTSETLTFALAAGTLKGQVLWVHFLIAEFIADELPRRPRGAIGKLLRFLRAARRLSLRERV